jgi:hypothetical protein
MKKYYLVLLPFLLLGSCKKDEDNYQPVGNYATQNDLNNGLNGITAKSYNFSLTYGVNTNTAVYNMPDNSMYGKVTFVYVDRGFYDWVMLPYYANNPGYVPVNYIATCDEISEVITVETLRGDNVNSSPWAVNNVTKDFKAVVINCTPGKINPNDFRDYNKVKKMFNLKD